MMVYCLVNDKKRAFLVSMLLHALINAITLTFLLQLPTCLAGQSYSSPGRVLRPLLSVPSFEREEPSTPPRSILVTKDAFIVDGTPRLIRGASFQWYRMSQAVWKDRLLKLKGMGYNAVDMYVSWIHHQPRPDYFDFSTFDMAAFLRLASALDLFVYIRPGPYITNEQDGGGIPAWLFANSSKTMFNATHNTGHPNLRTHDAAFMAAVSRYYEAIAAIARPYQWTSGGPIILWAIENEYDWFVDFAANDKLATYHDGPERPVKFKPDPKAYLGKLRDLVRNCGITIPITTCPGIGFIRATGDLEDIIPMVNMYRDATATFTLSYSSWSLKRDMQDPSHHQGAYSQFPSGTSETHRFPDLLRSTVLAGMDAIFQFNQIAFHQQGRYNSLTLDSTDIYTMKQALKFLWDNTNLKNLPHAFRRTVLALRLGYFGNTIDYFSAVSPSGILRENYHSIRRTNMFFNSFEPLIASAGMARRISTERASLFFFTEPVSKLPGYDGRIYINNPHLGIRDPDWKRRVNYWLPLGNSSAVIGIYNEPSNTHCALGPNSISAFGKSFPEFSTITVPHDVATYPLMRTENQRYTMMLPYNFSLPGTGLRILYSTSEIVTFREWCSTASQNNDAPHFVLVVYGKRNAQGEISFGAADGTHIRLNLPKSGVKRQPKSSWSPCTLTYNILREPQSFQIVLLAGKENDAPIASYLTVVVVDMYLSGRVWFPDSLSVAQLSWAPNALIIGPDFVKEQGIPGDEKTPFEMEFSEDKTDVYLFTPCSVEDTPPAASRLGHLVMQGQNSGQGVTLYRYTRTPNAKLDEQFLHGGFWKQEPVPVEGANNLDSSSIPWTSISTVDESNSLENHGIYNGYAWYRSTFQLDPSVYDLGQLRAVHLFIEHASDIVGIYLNGRYITTLCPAGTAINSASPNVDYRFTIPKSALKPGRNVISFRVEVWGHGSFMFIRGVLDRIPRVPRALTSFSLPSVGFDSLRGLYGKTFLTLVYHTVFQRKHQIPLTDWMLRKGIDGETKGIPSIKYAFHEEMVADGWSGTSRPSASNVSVIVEATKSGASTEGAPPPLSSGSSSSSFPLYLAAGQMVWYRTTFRTADLASVEDWNMALNLVIRGKNCKATIWLNGILIGRWLSDEGWMHRGTWAHAIRDPWNFWQTNSPDEFPIDREALARQGGGEETLLSGRTDENVLVVFFEDTSDPSASVKAAGGGGGVVSSFSLCDSPQEASITKVNGDGQVRHSSGQIVRFD